MDQTLFSLKPVFSTSAVRALCVTVLMFHSSRRAGSIEERSSTPGTCRFEGNRAALASPAHLPEASPPWKRTLRPSTSENRRGSNNQHADVLMLESCFVLTSRHA